MQIVICDDDVYCRKKLKEYCENYFQEQKKIAEIILVESGEDFFEKQLTPDLLFLDIEMNGMDGLNVARTMLLNGNKSTLVVYVTDHDDYAMEAFDMNVLSFLKKPVSYEKIEYIFHRANLRREAFQIIGYYKGQPILVGEVLYIEAESAYTRVWLKNGESFIERKTLGEWEEELKLKHFFRIHRSVLVNLQYVQKYEKHRKEIFLEDKRWKVPRNRAKEFNEVYIGYVESGAWR